MALVEKKKKSYRQAAKICKETTEEQRLFLENTHQEKLDRQER